MLKVAICDDESLMAGEISSRLSRYMEDRRAAPYSVGSFSSGRSLLESGCDFDVIFLDIRMEGADGLETARALRERGGRSLLIFVTVLKECVFDAFEVEAFDYLVKPLDADRFRRTMDRALRTLERRAAERVVVRRGTCCEVIPLTQIVYCEVQGRKVYLHQTDGTVTGYYDRLEALERRMDGRFFRCHRSYLVNLEYVRGCGGGQAALPGGVKIPVSRLRERELAQALLRYMKERGR